MIIFGIICISIGAILVPIIIFHEIFEDISCKKIKY